MPWGFGRFFTPSVPRKTKGGIKAQTKRGRTFGESWWAKRWIAVLEDLYEGGRLGRGRSYARNGQVLSIDISMGKIKAKVQGSRPKPYQVTIDVSEVSGQKWEKVIQALSQQAIFSAKLLAGEMPQEIEEVFESARVSLFPESYDELETNCSCPDWSNPCKHIAAVYYLLGEEFDRDPFLIFKLRGMDRDVLIKKLGNTGGGKKTKKIVKTQTLPPEPLCADVPTFWSGGEIGDDFYGEVRIPILSAALPKRLGNLPFWRAEERFVDVMERVYNEASEKGMAVFLDEG